MAEVTILNFMIFPVEKEMVGDMSESTSVMGMYETDVFYDAVHTSVSTNVFYNVFDGLGKKTNCKAMCHCRQKHLNECLKETLTIRFQNINMVWISVKLAAQSCEKNVVPTNEIEVVTLFSNALLISVTYLAY